eukprot:364565-Chlamydomonas_euryale.AAC.2
MAHLRMQGAARTGRVQHSDPQQHRHLRLAVVQRIAQRRWERHPAAALRHERDGGACHPARAHTELVVSLVQEPRGRQQLSTSFVPVASNLLGACGFQPPWCLGEGAAASKGSGSMQTWMPHVVERKQPGRGERMAAGTGAIARLVLHERRNAHSLGGCRMDVCMTGRERILCV